MKIDTKAGSDKILEVVHSTLEAAASDVCQIDKVWHDLVDAEKEKKKVMASNPIFMKEAEEAEKKCNSLALKLRSLYTKFLEVYKDDLSIISVFSLLMTRLKLDYLALFNSEDKKEINEGM